MLGRASTQSTVPVVLVAERCDAWEALAEEREIRLLHRIPQMRHCSALLVPGDSKQTDNLIANAMDAVSPGGLVRVTVVPVARAWRCT